MNVNDIGDAEEVAEGVAMGTTVLTTSTTEAKVKKAGKAVELTDESVLSGYGDPLGTAINQIAMSIAAKVDNDSYDALCTAPIDYDGTAAPISYSAVVAAKTPPARPFASFSTGRCAPSWFRLSVPAAFSCPSWSSCPC